MRKLFFPFVIFLFVLYSCGNQEHSGVKASNNDVLTIVDDLNDTLQFKKFPNKVISLAPNLTEMVYALRSDEKLIANTTYCNFPAGAEDKEKIGDMFSIDFEKIVALNPDLILITVEGNNKGSYEKLIELNFKVFVSNPRDYEGIVKTFTDLGKLFGKSSLADSVIALWNERLTNIKQESAARVKRKTLFLISVNPLMSASGKTFINEYLKYCNLKNIAEDSPVNYPVFSREEILRKNPEIIIVQQKIAKDDLLAQFPEWKNIDAIKNNKIIEIDPDLYFRPGPRFIEALENLNEQITMNN
ncbi:MAG: cobalamin-binding protein [Chlorobi bacterium]|nr:cobalamin-binding protein [Chlorobiota bacterium]